MQVTTTAPTQRLPPELVSHIFQHLAQDTYHSTIQNSALVSWAWCNCARLLIFRSISITTSAQKCRMWIVRLRSSPHLASLVVHLSLLGVYHFPGSFPSGIGSEPRWSIADAQELAKELPHIQTLTIANETLGEHGPYHEFFKYLHNLQKLHLLHIELEQPGHLFHFMTYAKVAPNLSELSMSFVGSHQRPAFALFRLLPVPGHIFGFGDAGIASASQRHQEMVWRLRRLMISSTEIRKDVLSLLSGPKFDYTRFGSLILESAIEPLCRDHGADPMVKDLLEGFMVVVGSSVRYLTLGVSNLGEGLGNDNLHLSYITSGSMLKHLRSLVRLVLRSGGGSGGLLPALGLSVASRLFSTLRGHDLPLEEIAIAMDVERFDEPYEMILHNLRSLQGWKMFDDRLESAVQTLSKFRRLLLVVSVRNGKALRNQLGAVIADALPKANARNTLDVHVDVPGPAIRNVIEELSHYDEG